MSSVGGTRQYGALVVNTAERSMTVDLSKLDAPDRAYDADYAWFEHEPGTTTLVFAKKESNTTERLRSRLEVRYAPENLLVSFWGNSRSFFTRAQKYVQQWSEDARRPVDPPRELPALQTHSEWATFTYISFSGTEAALDFCYVPAGTLLRILRGVASGGPKLTPVVRVQLTTFELVRLIDRI